MSIGTAGLLACMTPAAAVGFGACGLWYGVWTTQAQAAVQAQATGEQFVTTHQRIAKAEASATTARQAAQQAAREEHDHDPDLCPPGSGVLSEPVADGLRLALAEAAAATESPGPVRADSDRKVRGDWPDR